MHRSEIDVLAFKVETLRKLMIMLSWSLWSKRFGRWWKSWIMIHGLFEIDEFLYPNLFYFILVFIFDIEQFCFIWNSNR